MRFLSLLLTLIPATAWGSLTTIGPLGVDSQATRLNGSGVLIGQAERNRSGKAEYDDADRSASFTKPAGVYFQNNGVMDPMSSTGQSHIDEHATAVAGVMIDTSTFTRGVAPLAELHSIGISSLLNDSEVALALNRIAIINGGAVRATNMSFIAPIQLLEENGKSHLTQFVDWSARQHDLLYVAGWGNASSIHEFRKPQDNFNGITVAGSDRIGIGAYNRFADINAIDTDTNDQQSIDILAPSTGVLKLGWNDNPFPEDGTSFSAPHVTAAVALVQQYAQQQIDAQNPLFVDPIAKRHEVMKAVIMNSADKVEGVHGSTRTICDSPMGDCHDWRESEAFNSPFIPLDDKLGAGHLNVRRAIQQFAPGEYGPGEVPLIGWDRGIIGPSQTQEYVFSEDADGYIAITLAWDRVVNHSGGNVYNAGDNFLPYVDVDDVLSNLDVSLVGPEGIIVHAESRSLEMNLEHIFFEIQDAGQYRIRVEHTGGLFQDANYALAWWNGVAPPLFPPGDYDGNGSVGPEDYNTWRMTFGDTVSAGAGADGNGNGVIDAADYVVWRNAMTAGSGSAMVAVPEPSTSLLGTLLVFGLNRRRVVLASLSPVT